jgi:hypothetical protein
VIRERIDLEGVARDFPGEPVKRIGSRVARPCPFHDARNPSFAVPPG